MLDSFVVFFTYLSILGYLKVYHCRLWLVKSYVCVCVSVWCICICVGVCVCVCMYMYVCVCVYVHVSVNMCRHGVFNSVCFPQPIFSKMAWMDDCYRCVSRITLRVRIFIHLLLLFLNIDVI